MQNTWEGPITDTDICYCRMINVCRGCLISLQNPKNIFNIASLLQISPTNTQNRSWYWETKKTKSFGIIINSDRQKSLLQHGTAKNVYIDVFISSWSCLSLEKAGHFEGSVNLLDSTNDKILTWIEWLENKTLRLMKTRRNVFSIVIVCGCTG